MDLKDRIKAARTERGMSQEQLAKAVGKTRSAVAQWESGDVRPRHTTLEEIAEELGRSFTWLLTGKYEADVFYMSTAMSSAFAKIVQPKMEAAGMTPEMLAEKSSVPLDKILNLLDGKPNKLTPEENVLISSVLGFTFIDELQKNTGQSDVTGIGETPTSVPSVQTAGGRAPLVEYPLRSESPQDVPVLGTAAGSDIGVFQFEGGVIDYVRRPPALTSAKGIYAIYIVGDSMEPEHRPGDLRFINPHKAPRIGDSIIIETKKNEQANQEAMIGHLLLNSADHYLIGKLRPAIEIKIAKSDTARLHKILDINELFGV